jgi:hypothetical protein
VVLPETLEVVDLDILHVPFVYLARGDQAGCYQLAQPLRRERVVLVVVGVLDH